MAVEIVIVVVFEMVNSVGEMWVLLWAETFFSYRYVWAFEVLKFWNRPCKPLSFDHHRGYDMMVALTSLCSPTQHHVKARMSPAESRARPRRRDGGAAPDDDLIIVTSNHRLRTLVATWVSG